MFLNRSPSNPQSEIIAQKWPDIHWFSGNEKHAINYGVMTELVLHRKSVLFKIKGKVK